MHELSLCQALIQLVRERTAPRPIRQLTHITVAIGSLAGVDADAFAFAFSAIRDQALHPACQLELVSVPAFGRCANCGRRDRVQYASAGCSYCGHWPVQLEPGGDDICLTGMKFAATTPAFY
ncbi:hydrogenase maturation nickel metallochaperone HypA [Reinekea sp.]|uniref:hydrogenase maturation nickel metallochaperone HypA/HybF n=1 Tax=Reinekea sp. TaxID=1970455 RepID=UPI002A7F9561|nr:hydrogenase maturation nickel metallochaperone HypA [Reinekea sp.]